MQVVNHPLLEQRKVRLLVKRDDLIHPDISGNKWRKLKYNLEEAQTEGHDSILTFGGAFSNHIAATAVCASVMGFKSIGVIRGEARYASNPTLSLAKRYGMRLDFVSRRDYRSKEEPGFLDRLALKWGRCYVIPEGGANKLGRRGCEEILKTVSIEHEYVAVAMGTGTTFLGIMDGLGHQKKMILGFPVLKGFDELDEMLSLSFPNKSYQLFKDYHFGGYAKFTDPLVSFINDFKRQTGVRLDPIYTGKMMYGLFDLIGHAYFPQGSTILAIHTGGLQGIAGFNSRYGSLIDE